MGEAMMTRAMLIGAIFVFVAAATTAQDVPFRTVPTPEDRRLEIGPFSRQPRGTLLTVRTMGGHTIKGRLMKSDGTVIVLEAAKAVEEIHISKIEAVRHQ